MSAGVHALPFARKLVLVGVGKDVAAILESPEAPLCNRISLALRIFGRLGERIPYGQGRVRFAPKSKTQAVQLVKRLLRACARNPLGPSEGVWAVHEERSVRRGLVLPHPDQPACERHSWNADEAARDILECMKRSPQRPPPLERLYRALNASPFAPLEISEEHGPKGTYPYDIPFIWGSVHLARLLDGDVRSVSTQGGVFGSGESTAKNRLIAMSEGCERLAARGVRPDCILRESEDPRCVPIQSLYGWATSSDATEKRGYRFGVNLIDNTPRLVPYDAVVVALPRDIGPSRRHHEPFYSGAASHTSLSAAVVNGTIELVHRDAYMITWYRKRRLRRVRWPGRLSAKAQSLKSYLEQAQMQLELFDMTLDFPLPTLLLRVTSTRAHASWPKDGAILFPAAAFQRMKALEHVLGLAAGQYISLVHHSAPIKNPLKMSAIREMTKLAPFWPAIARYLDPRNSHCHAFLAGSEEVSFSSLPDYRPSGVLGELDLLKRWLQERGLSWLVCRITDSTASYAGFEVAKVCVPGLIGMAASQATVNVTMPRLHVNWPDATTRLNTDPHPLY